MMNCETFQSRFHPNVEDAEVLAHLRTCDRCLDFAASSDPDVMFRALGGDEMVPPGGVDAFVAGVMQQVRGAETAAAVRRTSAWPRRLAIAATVAATVSAAMLMRSSGPATSVPMARAAAPRPVAAVAAAVHPVALTTKPIVETYESENATIVEVPSEAADNVKVVMIFDENLPADL